MHPFYLQKERFFVRTQKTVGFTDLPIDFLNVKTRFSTRCCLARNRHLEEHTEDEYLIEHRVPYCTHCQFRTTMMDPQQSTNAVPESPPVTSFTDDPKVRDIFLTQDGDYFGLVLVTGWRFDQELIRRPYSSLLRHVVECFDPQDLVGSGSPDTTSQTQLSSESSAVYLYPPEHLHITVATFARPSPKQENKHYRRDGFDVDEFQDTYKNLLSRAAQSSDWPTEPMKFVVKSVSIGSKAGIILWEDITGGITKIRSCLRQAASGTTFQNTCNDDTTDDTTSTCTPIEIEDVPNIIHTTFLRFQSVPTTPYHVVQERFLTKVKPCIVEIFSVPSNESSSSLSSSPAQASTKTLLVADTVKLVCESSPYMHVPHDENHILSSIFVGKVQS